MIVRAQVQVVEDFVRSMIADSSIACDRARGILSQGAFRRWAYDDAFQEYVGLRPLSAPMEEIRAQATRDTEKIAQDIRARAEQEATETRMKAQADARAQVETALSDANRQIADLAIAATEKLLGRELGNKSEQQRLVEEYLSQQNGSTVR